MAKKEIKKRSKIEGLASHGLKALRSTTDAFKLDKNKTQEKI